jgi:hypothetical protein
MRLIVGTMRLIVGLIVPTMSLIMGPRAHCSNNELKCPHC